MSERWVWFLLALLALAGIGTSSYLTYSHYADQATVCAGIGSCEFVQTSEYSKVAGVPVVGIRTWRYIAGYDEPEINDHHTVPSGPEDLLPKFLRPS